MKPAAAIKVKDWASATKTLPREDGSGFKDHENSFPGITDSAAFSADASPHNQEDEQRSRSQKIGDGARKVGHAIAHPRQAAKSHATSKLLATERPWLKDQVNADQTWLDAHDQLDAADEKLRGGSFDAGPDGFKPPVKELEDATHKQEETLENVEEERKQLHAGWHMSRYVTRARVIRKGELAFPPKRLYEQHDPQGRYIRTDWIRWIGHIMFWACQDCSMHYIDPTNEVPYDRDVLVSQIERLLVASEAFQLWWMRVRKVYSWEDPWLTARWLILFLVLLKTGYVMTFYWGYLLFSVVTNRTGRHTRHWMRDSHQRAHEATKRASMLSELVVRHGQEHWLEPMLDEFGPWLQLQVGDVADFLESTANYYDWRNVTSTTSTCIAYVALFLVSAIPRLDYSIKVFWLAGGLYFFLSRPISTNFPRFRHAVDPMRWMYWDSPTSSELIFSYLRTRAWNSMAQQGVPLPIDDLELSDSEDEAFEDAVTSLPAGTAKDVHDNNGPAAATIVSFSARWEGRSGMLELTSHTIRFVERSRFSKSGARCWERRWSHMLEVRKGKRPGKPGSRRPPHALVLLWREHLSAHQTPSEMSHAAHPDHVDELYGMTFDARNDAFNAIIGISGAWWMELQPEPKEQDRMH